MRMMERKADTSAASLVRAGDSGPVARLHVPEAAPGLGLLFQSGVRVDCVTGIPLERLLSDELELDRELRDKLDVYLLDGRPVDAPAEAIVRDGSRLALAAGLPGIAGLAMRSGSAVAALRPGITHFAAQNAKEAQPQPGSIELVLFSLALPLLAPHVLRRGILVSVGKLLPYMRPALLSTCILNNRTMNLKDAGTLLLTLPPRDLVFLTASMPGAKIVQAR